MKYFALSLLPLLLMGCKTTEIASEQTYSQLDIIQGELTSKKWKNLNRFSPLYPMKASVLFPPGWGAYAR